MSYKELDPGHPVGRLLPQSRFEDGLRQIQNLATWVALGGTVPKEREPGHPDWRPSWAIMCQGKTA